jgi:YD repeat-containing protein
MDDATGITYRTYDELSRNISKTVPGIGKSTYEYNLPAEEIGEHAERTAYEYNRNGSRY